MKRDLKINFGVLDSLLGELYEFRQAVENMQDGVRIVPFENTDDAYKKRAQEVYDKYTNFGERMSNVGTAIDKAVDDFGNGLLQSVVDTVVGLVKLPYGLVQYVADGSVVLFCKMIGSPVPSWAGKHFNGTNDMISSVVNDPFLLIEGLAQGISDTYEDEGIVYMSGYVAGEALQIYMAKRFSNRAKEMGSLDQKTINEIISTRKGERPDPIEYMGKSTIDSHLENFENGVAKFTSSAPTGVAGPPGGTFVMPKELADDLIKQAGGDISKLEQLLGLDVGSLGESPSIIFVEKPSGLRFPSGNELGANSQWLPGGYTSGGIMEAIIDSPSPSDYVIIPID